MKLGITFAAIAVACLLAAWALPSAGGLVLLWPGASSALLASGYFRLGARVVGKRSDGSIPSWSRLVHAPYFLFCRAFYEALRARARIESPSQLSPELVLAGFPEPKDLEFVRGSAVLDATAEFESARTRELARRFRALPVLDESAPKLTELRDALAWLSAEPGPKFIHCAFGRGRSATFAVAYMVHSGESADVRAAIGEVQRLRPSVRLHQDQVRMLLDAEREGLLSATPPQS